VSGPGDFRRALGRSAKVILSLCAIVGGVEAVIAGLFDAMKKLTLLLAFLFVIGHLSAQTQSEMNSDAAARLEAADAKLNRTYQAVLKQHADEEVFLTNLKEAQRIWLKYVDLHLKTVFPLEEGEDPRVVYGSIYPLDYAETKIPLLEARIEQLKGFLE